LYAEVSAKIIAELERGAAPCVKPWSVTPGQNTPQNAVTNWWLRCSTLRVVPGEWSS
jgi:antirestriction protein ArdC